MICYNHLSKKLVLNNRYGGILVASLIDEFHKKTQIREALECRRQAWMRIFKKGRATFSEMMEADFGTRNPKGLDIDNQFDDKEIALKMGMQLISMGKTSWQKPDSIQLHPILKLFSYLPVPTNLKIPVIQKHISDIHSHESLHSRQIKEDVDGMGWRFNSTFSKAANIEETIKGKWVRAATRLCSLGKYKVQGYLDNEQEIQARLHEIFTNAYQDWGKLPVTQNEFIAAAYHVDLQVPPELISELEQTKEGQKALQDFQVHPIIKTEVKFQVTLLNAVNKYAKACNISPETWKDLYSHYYGGILELYQDKKGLSRIISGYPETHETKKVLYEIYDKELTNQDIDDYAQKIPDDCIELFLHTARKHRNPESLVRKFAQAFANRGVSVHNCNLMPDKTLPSIRKNMALIPIYSCFN